MHADDALPAAMTPDALIRAEAEVARAVRGAIRDVPDFPKPGIVFKDITPVLADASLFARAIDALAAPYVGQGITHVAAIESRGFILGAPIARVLGAGFLPVRKRGKLPYESRAVEYALEYGTDALEMHVDACVPESRVLIVDDVLATGGTASAARRLVEDVGGGIAGFAFLIALSFLPGLDALRGVRKHVLVTY